MFAIQPTEEQSPQFSECYAVNIEMWWWQKPFVERIHAAADAGFTHVEFWPYENKDIDAIAAACKERGITVAQFTAWGFAHRVHPEWQATAKKTLACLLARCESEISKI